MTCASRSRFKLAAVALGVLFFGLVSCGETSTEGFDLIEKVPPHTRTGLQAWTQSNPEHPPASESPVQLLIAARTLRDPIFGRSVVLLLEHSPKGALGLMINRPTDVSLHEALPATRQWAERGDRLFLGGPVETQLIAFLMRSESPPPHSKRVFSNVYATGDPEALVTALERPIKSDQFRAYLGYAGWGPGQLDDEMARGDWYQSPAHPDFVFSPPRENLWEHLVFEHEGTQVDLGRPPHSLAAPGQGQSGMTRLAAMVRTMPDELETNGD